MVAGARVRQLRRRRVIFVGEPLDDCAPPNARLHASRRAYPLTRRAPASLAPQAWGLPAEPPKKVPRAKIFCSS